MKSFQKVFSKLEKNCSSTCGQVVQLNDFLPGFLLSMSFCRRMGNTVFFIVLCQSSGYFKGLKSKFGYFLWFSKKKFQ